MFASGRPDIATPKQLAALTPPVMLQQRVINLEKRLVEQSQLLSNMMTRSSGLLAPSPAAVPPATVSQIAALEQDLAEQADKLFQVASAVSASHKVRKVVRKCLAKWVKKRARLEEARKKLPARAASDCMADDQHLHDEVVDLVAMDTTPTAALPRKRRLARDGAASGNSVADPRGERSMVTPSNAQTTFSPPSEPESPPFKVLASDSSESSPFLLFRGGEEEDEEDAAPSNDVDASSCPELEQGINVSPTGMVLRSTDDEKGASTNHTASSDGSIPSRRHATRDFFGAAAPVPRHEPLAHVHDLHKVNLQVFGHRNFRPFQLEIIRSVYVERRDCFGLLGTGAGKSLTFMLPAALATTSVAVVIVPISTLARQHAAKMNALGLRAEALVGDEAGWAATKRAQELLATGQLRAVFLGPEMAATSPILETLQKHRNVSALVLDEIDLGLRWSRGTQALRPSFLWLKQLRARFPNVPVLALSATLPKSEVRELSTLLAIKDPLIYRAALDRPNIFLSVQKKQGKSAKTTTRLMRCLGDFPNGKAIIYTRSKFRANDLAKLLAAESTNSRMILVHHADVADRCDVERKFAATPRAVVVATTSFSQGVDDPDITTVVFETLPKSCAALVQGMGRAGRKGQASQAVVLYSMPEAIRYMRLCAADEAARQDQQAVASLLEDPYTCLCRTLYQRVGSDEPFPEDEGCTHCGPCSSGSGTLVATRLSGLEYVIRHVSEYETRHGKSPTPRQLASAWHAGDITNASPTTPPLNLALRAVHGLILRGALTLTSVPNLTNVWSANRLSIGHGPVPPALHLASGRR